MESGNEAKRHTHKTYHFPCSKIGKSEFFKFALWGKRMNSYTLSTDVFMIFSQVGRVGQKAN